MRDAELRDRHVVVTGAGTGIGRAIAVRLARDGARLSLLARRQPPLDETAGLARAAGSPRVVVRECDVRQREAVDAAFAACAEEQGALFALVANSGIGGPDRPTADAPDRFDDLVATNLRGSHACARAALAHLDEGPDARHLVFMSSILGRIGVPGYAGYCSSKAGILGLTRALACELGPKNVQVNAVCPGWVDTVMARNGLEDIARVTGTSVEEARESALSEVPLGRMGAPEDVAGVVAWLLSSDARGVTGQGIDVNGGAFMS